MSSNILLLYIIQKEKGVMLTNRLANIQPRRFCESQTSASLLVCINPFWSVSLWRDPDDV